MKATAPASLIQIHYHDRPGGVREVMASYSRAFKEVAGINGADIWICNRSGACRYSDCQGIHVPQADYHRFRSPKAFLASAEYLTGTLAEILRSADVRFPVAVVGHNLNLGKNIALSAAFSRCACQFGENPGRYRFFSVLHDFAEDGRCNLMAPLRRLKTAGVDVDGILYAAGAPVRFIVLNRNAAALSGLDKKNMTILPNRIQVPATSVATMDRTSLREQLQLLAKSDGCMFDPVRKLFCYPSRMIYRKNIFEAFLLATVILQGSLVTGAAGTAIEDRRRLDTVRQLARKYRRSFVADPSRMYRNRRSDSLTLENPFVKIYPAADAVVTTSRAEGFGYSLFEPWRYGRKVIGRMPESTSLLPSMRAPSLYRRLLIPAGWVSVDKCYRHFADCYSGTFEKPYPSLRTFTAEFIHDGAIDFGILDEPQQIAIINRLHKSDNDHALFMELLKKKARGWPGLEALEAADHRLVRHNSQCVKLWSDAGFINVFVKCLSSHPLRPDRPFWYAAVARYFRHIGNFRPNATL